MNETVCAVVVTYNRKDLLIECLMALRKQTRPLQRVYIIDNASTDDTPQLLLETGYIEILPPLELSSPWEKEIKVFTFGKSTAPIKVHYVRMNKNTGGAGGFYEGMLRANQHNFDWLWLMDDDGYPPEKCLEILLQEAKTNGIEAINPLVVDKNNHSQLSFGLGKNLMTVDELMMKFGNNSLLLNKGNPFNGTLLHRNVVAKCGFVKKEMFIWGDEQEYFLRLNAAGFNYATTLKTKYYHPLSKSETISYFFGLFSVQVKPQSLEMNYYRNMAYIIKNYARFPKTAMIRSFLKYSIFFMLKADFKKIWTFLSYFLDGWNDSFCLPPLRQTDHQNN